MIFSRGVNYLHPQMEVVNISFMMGRQVNPLLVEQELKDTLFLVLNKGHGKLLVDGRDHTVVADNLWVFSAGTLVRLELAPSSFGTLLLVSGPLASRVRGSTRMRVSNARAKLELTNIFSSLETELRQRYPAYGIAAESYFGQLLVFLERNQKLIVPSNTPFLGAEQSTEGEA